MLLDYLFADEPEAPGEFSLVRVSRRAMATTFEVAIPVGSHTDPVAAAEDALDLIDELEDQMTVYRDHSEVSRVNASASAGFVGIEPQLFDLLSRCAIWTKETGGAFDIATGALTKAWGFFRREPDVPAPRDLVEAMRATGARHVLLDAEQRAVKFRVSGLELNLGAVGKGYALDRAADLLRTKWGVRSALLHGGGSSVCAIGGPPGDSRGWPIRLKNPKPDSEDGESLGTVRLFSAGLGTSAATFQFFEYKGQKLGHLLDPRTGWPAFGTASASVIAPTAAEADAMSTAAFVLGAAGAETLTRLRPALGAVVASEDSSPTPPPNREGSSLANDSAPPSPTKGGEGITLRSFNLAPDVYSPPDHAD